MQQFAGADVDLLFIENPLYVQEGVFSTQICVQTTVNVDPVTLNSDTLLVDLSPVGGVAVVSKFYQVQHKIIKWDKMYFLQMRTT